MIFGHFTKVLALLFMHILAYFLYHDFWTFSKVLALLLMHILEYFLFIDFWAFSKGVTNAFYAHFGIFFIS